ncbi:MAG: hypothetical protein JWR53_682 [Glaciihabitans sp.]|nr:hypothetical protein [Glaciihabitans sp.]
MDNTGEDKLGPLGMADLLELDEQDCVEVDKRPWGIANENAFAFWSEGELSLRRGDTAGSYTLRGDSPIYSGIRLVDEEDSRQQTVVRSLEERRIAREARLSRDRPDRVHVGVEGFRPGGVPAAYLPRTFSALGSVHRGLSARGGRVGLSDSVTLTQDGDAHSTVFDGESRDYLRPTDYPYTAVCKLEYWTMDPRTKNWASTGSYASGFLVGRRTLLTSGHAFAKATSADAIKVIPACWGNRPVFGEGAVTWVVRRMWWHSDSGNDLQLCHLADPIGDAMGYFGAREYDSDWEDQGRWTMAGFPYDRSQYGMSVQTGIHVRDDDDGDDINLDGNTYDTTQVENDADEASGASGSPLFAWFGKDNACAIGVHAGYEIDGTAFGDETWSCAAGGEGFVEIVKWGRRNWD